MNSFRVLVWLLGFGLLLGVLALNNILFQYFCGVSCVTAHYHGRNNSNIQNTPILHDLKALIVAASYTFTILFTILQELSVIGFIAVAVYGSVLIF
jgi:polyferredoxin